jgi:hypothetical protein
MDVGKQLKRRLKQLIQRTIIEPIIKPCGARLGVRKILPNEV